MSTHRRNYRHTCKMPDCGKPRWEHCSHALCEDHYLEYQRAASKQTYARKRGGVVGKQGRRKTVDSL